MPTALPTPCPSGPVVVSTPAVYSYSGWPGVLLFSWRNCFSCSIGKDGSLSTSPLWLTFLICARWMSEYTSIEPCPLDRTNRSRFGHIGSAGS